MELEKLGAVLDKLGFNFTDENGECADGVSGGELRRKYYGCRGRTMIVTATHDSVSMQISRVIELEHATLTITSKKLVRDNDDSFDLMSMFMCFCNYAEGADMTAACYYTEHTMSYVVRSLYGKLFDMTYGKKGGQQ